MAALGVCHCYRALNPLLPHPCTQCTLYGPPPLSALHSWLHSTRPPLLWDAVQGLNEHDLLPKKGLAACACPLPTFQNEMLEGVCRIHATNGNMDTCSCELAGDNSCRALYSRCLGPRLLLGGATVAVLWQVRLPPLSQDPNRCERAFVGNTIGQANGVADKLLDLRKCNFANNKTDLKGKTLSAALMSDAIFDNADMTEVVMSKAYAGNASFKGTHFQHASPPPTPASAPHPLWPVARATARLGSISMTSLSS